MMQQIVSTMTINEYFLTVIYLQFEFENVLKSTKFAKSKSNHNFCKLAFF